jgi:eukaryotic-like serine/threonine-protein kinase
MADGRISGTVWQQHTATRLRARINALKAGCPEEATVLAFLDAKLFDQGRVDVERHVAACVGLRGAFDLGGGGLSQRAAPDTAGSAAPGTRVDRYQILEAMGQGGMGEVYAAHHPDLDRRIALKVVHEKGLGTEDRRARLLRQARATGG